MALVPHGPETAGRGAEGEGWGAHAEHDVGDEDEGGEGHGRDDAERRGAAKVRHLPACVCVGGGEKGMPGQGWGAVASTWAAPGEP